MDEETRILSISIEGSGGTVLRARKSDESSFLMDADDPAAALARSFRDSGDPLDGPSIEALASADGSYRCRRKAMDLLARSEQCRRGLESKLGRKGWSREAVSAALDRLEAAGFLDDRRFAEAWTRSRLRSRPEGPSRLIGGLMAKGVSGGIAREAVDTVLEELGDEAADDALERAREKLSRRSNMTEDKLVSSLVRRGFPIGKVRQAVRRGEGEEQ